MKAPPSAYDVALEIFNEELDDFMQSMLSIEFITYCVQRGVDLQSDESNQPA